ncbi:hypothetical protein [Jeongeupia chitinilytica]|uniref:Uncharacterized protein n=1 Tax=Jeongeupia chitinilytica TaxID=1041641 RepID=A0ABQ3H127_9NEIS|nr:hypothetical protein [Jeongeupia chitinilytica]GHD64939.1 hypothetical protein GCM10007350_24900 [Jeongeupia chitinilytica]
MVAAVSPLGYEHPVLRTDPAPRVLVHEERLPPESRYRAPGEGWNGVERRSGDDRRNGEERRQQAQKALLDTRGRQDRRARGRRATDAAVATSVSLRV